MALKVAGAWRQAQAYAEGRRNRRPYGESGPQLSRKAALWRLQNMIHWRFLTQMAAELAPIGPMQE